MLNLFKELKCRPFFLIVTLPWVYAAFTRSLTKGWYSNMIRDTKQTVFSHMGKNENPGNEHNRSSLKGQSSSVLIEKFYYLWKRPVALRRSFIHLSKWHFSINLYREATDALISWWDSNKSCYWVALWEMLFGGFWSFVGFCFFNLGGPFWKGYTKSLE